MTRANTTLNDLLHEQSLVLSVRSVIKSITEYRIFALPREICDASLCEKVVNDTEMENPGDPGQFQGHVKNKTSRSQFYVAGISSRSASFRRPRRRLKEDVAGPK